MLLKSAFSAWVPSFPLISLLLSLKKKTKLRQPLKCVQLGGRRGHSEVGRKGLSVSPKWSTSGFPWTPFLGILM